MKNINGLDMICNTPKTVKIDNKRYVLTWPSCFVISPYTNDILLRAALGAKYE